MGFTIPKNITTAVSFIIRFLRVSWFRIDRVLVSLADLALVIIEHFQFLKSKSKI